MYMSICCIFPNFIEQSRYLFRTIFVKTLLNNSLIFTFSASFLSILNRPTKLQGPQIFSQRFLQYLLNYLNLMPSFLHLLVSNCLYCLNIMSIVFLAILPKMFFVQFLGFLTSCLMTFQTQSPVQLRDKGLGGAEEFLSGLALSSQESSLKGGKNSISKSFLSKYGKRQLRLPWLMLGGFSNMSGPLEWVYLGLARRFASAGMSFSSRSCDPEKFT